MNDFDCCRGDPHFFPSQVEEERWSSTTKTSHWSLFSRLFRSPRKERPNGYPVEWVEKYGRVFTVPSPLPGIVPDFVAVADPALTKELCVVQSNQYRPPSTFSTRSEVFAKATRNAVGQSLVSSTGEEWKWRRAAFLKEMHKSKLLNEERQLLTFLFETGETVLCQRLKQAAISGNTVKVDILATEAAMDTILYFMFRKTAASMKKEGISYDPDSVRQAAKDTMAYMVASLTPGLFSIAQHIPGTKPHAVLRKRNAAWKIFDELIQDELQIMIQEARGERERSKDRRPGSILEQWLLLEPKFYERGLGPIIAECRGLILAGFETTAHALAYSFGMMAENPELSKKLHDISIRALKQKCISAFRVGFCQELFLGGRSAVSVGSSTAWDCDG